MRKYTFGCQFWHEFRVVPLERAGREVGSKAANAVTWYFLSRGYFDLVAFPHLAASSVGYLGFRAIIILIAQVVTVLIPLIERSFLHVLDRPSSRLPTFRYDMARPTT